MPATAQAITWTDIVNCTLVGTTLTKTGGVDASDAGAHSVQQLNGTGYAEFTNPMAFASPSKSRWFGFSTYPTLGVDYTDIPFAIYLNASNQIKGSALGSLTGVLGTYAQNDVLRITVAASGASYAVSMYQNGTLLYTFPGAPTFPLFVDCVMFTPAGEISDGMIYGVQTAIQFTDTSTSDTTAWLWNFGDGSTSTSQNPTHTYAANGTYSVSLTVTGSKGQSIYWGTVVIADGALESFTPGDLNPTPGGDPQIMLRISNDGGKTWVAETWRSAGKVGEYLQRVDWNRLGCARRRVFEVSCTDPVPWRIVNAFLESSLDKPNG